MTFFFDSNLSHHVPEVLRIVGYRGVLHVRDEFDGDPGDAAILRHAAANGWVIVTADVRMRSDPATAAAFGDGAVTAVFVGGPVFRRRIREQVIWFLRRWPDIETAVGAASPGTVLEARWRRPLREIRP